MRIQKYLAQAGVGSRRYCETLLAEGRITINNEVATEPGAQVDPARDEVLFDGEKVQPVREQMVLMLNKPSGFVTSRYDPYGCQTVFDLLPEELRYIIYPVGRLVKDTEGLLLFTNRGELNLHLTHPRYSVDKTYEVTVRGRPTHEQLKKLEPGVDLGNFKTAPAKVSEIRRQENRTVFHLSIHEGKKRQVRRMCKEVGLKLQQLVRIRQGSLELGNLERGKWRYLNKKEIARLESELGIASAQNPD